MSFSVISRYPLGHRARLFTRSVNRACRTCLQRGIGERAREGAKARKKEDRGGGLASGRCHWRQSSPPRSVPSRINYPGDGCTLIEERLPWTGAFCLFPARSIPPRFFSQRDLGGCYRIERNHRSSSSSAPRCRGSLIIRGDALVNAGLGSRHSSIDVTLRLRDRAAARGRGGLATSCTSCVFPGVS